ncbi:Inner centromere protein, partial [Lamprotornis superbus]
PLHVPPANATRMKGCKQALGVLWHRQQTGSQVLSPLDEKHKTSANQALSSPSPASKAVRPLKNFLQGQGGGIKDFIRRNTPTRPPLKEKERQRLENLRKKQEAEEQRKKKVEEEKRRRQAEMKQKREERLRKALQARERAEQMEEKKKKRVEQKILQSDEKVKEEKVAEEWSKRKGSKKHGEADARKQKALRGGENEQQEPLQKRREDEVKERGKTVLELKNLLEQQQLGQAKERDPKQRGKEKPLQAQQEPAALAGKAAKPGEEKKPIQPAAPGPWPNKAIKVSLRLLWLLGPRGSEPPRRSAQGIRWKNKWLVAKKMLEAATGGQQVLRRHLAGLCGAFYGQSGRKGCSELGCNDWNLLWGCGLCPGYVRAPVRENRPATEYVEGFRVEYWDMDGVPFPGFSTENRRGGSVKSGCQGTEPSASFKSLSTSCLGSLKGAQGPGSPPANENSYGLDLNSDDSTDDESNPRKPVPAWADGAQLQQAIVHQYYHPVDVDALFGAIPSPRLEHIFYKSKPRYFKRTSSA